LFKATHLVLFDVGTTNQFKIHQPMKKTILSFAFASACLFATAQQTTNNIGIGTSTPEASAKLHVSANNKGVMIPHVSLINSADAMTIASPATSLLVFNTNAALNTPDGSGTGYYYNNGTPSAPQWVRLSTGSLTTAKTIGNVSPSRTVSIGEIEIRYNGTANNSFLQIRSTTGANIDTRIFIVESWTSTGYGVSSGPVTLTPTFANVGSAFGQYNEMNTFYINVPASGNVYRVTVNLFDANNEMLLIEKF
jgi:hypothetical protein